MNPRLARQLIYGGVFFAIIFFFAISFYTNTLKPAPSCFDGKQNQSEEGVDCGGPCIDCAIKSLERIAASADLVLVEDTVSAVIRFTNPNIFYGAPRFQYTLRFFDSAGDALATFQRETFIYPGQINKTIVEANLPVNIHEVGFEPEVVVSDPEWLSADTFQEPETAIRQRSSVFSPEGDSVETTGLLLNRSPFSIDEIEIGALVYDRRGSIAGASRTTLFNLPAFSEHFFKVVVPIEDQRDINIQKTEIVISAK